MKHRPLRSQPDATFDKTRTSSVQTKVTKEINTQRQGRTDRPGVSQGPPHGSAGSQSRGSY